MLGSLFLTKRGHFLETQDTDTLNEWRTVPFH